MTYAAHGLQWWACAGTSSWLGPCTAVESNSVDPWRLKARAWFSDPNLTLNPIKVKRKHQFQQNVPLANANLSRYIAEELRRRRGERVWEHRGGDRVGDGRAVPGGGGVADRLGGRRAHAAPGGELRPLRKVRRAGMEPVAFREYSQQGGKRRRLESGFFKFSFPACKEEDSGNKEEDGADAFRRRA